MDAISENIATWGKDHWSLLAYVETCCVDNQGVLNLERMRINPFKRPFGTRGSAMIKETEKTYPYGSRMKDDVVPDREHDDLDVLDDLEAAGLLRNVGTMVNPRVVLTERGLAFSSKIREHKIKGGNYGTFSPI